MILASLLLALAPQDYPIRAPHRPRDPWVIRSVLDDRPRMVTIALSDEMWVAYDAQSSSLYKAWKGGVKFDGAVYTTVHGVAPTSQGRSYTEGPPDPVWSAVVGGKEVAVLVQWRGYSFNEGHVVLQFEMTLPDGRIVHVQEAPEFVRPETLFNAEHRGEFGFTAGHPGLMRSFYARDVPEDVRLRLLIRTEGVSARLGEAVESVEGDKEGRLSYVVLSHEKAGNNVLLFFAPLEPQAEAPKEGGRGK